MTPVELREHQTHPRVALQDDQVRSLVALGVATAEQRTDGWRLRTNQHVGCVQAGAAEVWIHPKVPTDRLLYLAGWARAHTPSYDWRDDDVHLGEAGGLVPVMAIMLTKLLGRAFRPGVLHGYQEREERLPLVRGRIRMSAQVQRHPGLPLPLEVSYQELVADIPENRRLLAAVLTVLPLPGVPPRVRAQLIQLRGRLAGVSVARGGRLPPSPPVTRLNAHYQPALRLADVILGGNSVDQMVGSIQATGFLLDMNVVFQEYLAGMLTHRLESGHGGTVTAPDKNVVLKWSDGLERPLLPDIVWRRRGRVAAVIDAKYKGSPSKGPRGAGPASQPGPLGVEPGDVYQVFTYCKALGADRGHLIHADTRSPRSRSIEIDGVRITVHALDLGQPLAGLREREAALVSEIAG